LFLRAGDLVFKHAAAKDQDCESFFRSFYAKHAAAKDQDCESCWQVRKGKKEKKGGKKKIRPGPSAIFEKKVDNIDNISLTLSL